ncbi:HigA family addiction module antitoxin [Parabacteroides sp. PF5-6]|uniref:HigA family addiction module antitoxin n=1 Tax=Parabacteroides sp. PF5-6 TaxID=1742403 RepID=UPI0024074361|nr:HigA family addiction module antitoxin [Parabacteroides sp. PF5-6]MDF9828950.1 addiction module HigA family antidote [Parabacteroides sp. PF5-6]
MIEIKGIDPQMIANNLTPYEPTHPGEVLKEEIEYRGLSQRKLAAQMGISYTLLNEVLNKKRQVNTEFSMLIEAALGIDADMLMRMQARYNRQMASKDQTFAARLEKVRQAVALL